nr:hypothetical protein [Acidithiobacillus sulfuriphilus]
MPDDIVVSEMTVTGKKGAHIPLKSSSVQSVHIHAHIRPQGHITQNFRPPGRGSVLCRRMTPLSISKSKVG